ncbi:MAG: energy transducer TonB [Crocinitomicaceae bacterium]|nr:energy transducer TonB [Crocinitomicaceae bacterium]
MIAKKSKKANLERKRFAFFQIGLLISGSMCLAAFEYSSAVPDEYVHEPDEHNGTTILDIPEDFDYKIIKEKQKTAKVVNLDQIEKIKIVKKLTVEGNPLIAEGNETISVEGDGDPYGGIDMGLEEEPLNSDDPLGWSERMPEFPGGETAMFEFIQKNINYPELPKDMGIEGIVYVHFVVNRDGSVSELLTSKAPHDDLSREAKRVVGSMPKWIPGEHMGKTVRVRYTLPIHFKLK